MWRYCNKCLSGYQLILKNCVLYFGVGLIYVARSFFHHFAQDYKCWINNRYGDWGPCLKKELGRKHEGLQRIKVHLDLGMSGWQDSWQMGCHPRLSLRMNKTGWSFKLRKGEYYVERETHKASSSTLPCVYFQSSTFSKIMTTFFGMVISSWVIYTGAHWVKARHVLHGDYSLNLYSHNLV